MSGERPRLDDPVAELLINHSFTEVASALRATADSIIRSWESSVLEMLPEEKKLDETQLRDHLPQILELLSDLLAEDDPGETRRLLKSPIDHGATRFEQRYDTSQFIIEYRLLRRVLLSEVEKFLARRLSSDEDIALDIAIDSMLQRGVVAFVHRQEERLQSATEGEKKYLSFLSHDLRNNLNAVIMELEVLKRRLVSASEFADAVADLDFAQQAVFETVDGMERLLQTERLRQRAEPVVTPVDVHAVAVEVVRRFQKRAAEKGLELAINVDRGITIHTDREWLTLALQNLVGNAVKFSASGTVRIGCARQPAQGRTAWIVSVADQGPGIAADRLDRIFSMFTRGETHGEAGVGLGLAVASQAARLLGAELTVQSQLGVGSTFQVLIPATEDF